MFTYFKIIIASAILSIGALVAPAQNSNQVYFYEHTNYGGAYMRWDGVREVPDLRSYNTGAIGTPNWNDRISSFKIGKDMKLVVFKDINYRGGSWTISGPATISTLVSNGWNDKISSFRIVPK